MKKSRIFAAQRYSSGSRYFSAKNADDYEGSDFTALHIDIPQKAKHIQIVCTVKRTANSVRIDAVSKDGLYVLARDFSDNVLPTKENWCHVLWW